MYRLINSNIHLLLNGISREYHVAPYISYFQLLEENRNNVKIQIERVVNNLYELESNSKGTHAVHFSFASKLAHTVDNTLPIYDSMIAAFYFFPDIKAHWNKNRKIAEYMASYQFLANEYGRVIENNLLGLSINNFRAHFAVGADAISVSTAI